MTHSAGVPVPDTAAAEKLAAEMEQQAAVARARMGTMHDHMLDVVEALRGIQASADSDELEAEGERDPADKDERHADPQREPLVTATVNGEGALVGLVFSDAALRRPHTEIERLVVAVAGRAAVKAAMAHAEVMRRSGLVRGAGGAD